jgi:alkylation response protein AidB-like acyl-CoA dehydrogenase
LAEGGLPLAWVPEELGGAGAGLEDGFAIAAIAGRYAAPVPLVETLLAGWLLAQVKIPSPAGMMTVAPARPNDRLTANEDGTISGRANGVPFARETKFIAVLADSATDAKSIALVEAKDCRLGGGENLAGEPSNVVTFERVKPQACVKAPADLDAGALVRLGAIVRSIEIAGALETILAMSVRYANERVAFERPIGKFQAVQQNLARLAGETAAALAASSSAADTFARGEDTGEPLFLEVAAAKIRAAEAAAEGAAIAHQVHGAIGFTKEHILHRFTLRLLGWRDDFGNEGYWAAALGNMIAQAGAAAFWPLIASR